MATSSKQLHQDGCAILRGAIPAQWLDELRGVFDASIQPSDQWPIPRGWGWQHAVLDANAQVRSVCRLPELLAVVRALTGERFFLAQAEGREPLGGAGHQSLHRDLSDQRPGDTVMALAYLDDYGAHNGATRWIPGSHRPAQQRACVSLHDDSHADSHATALTGQAGDILVFDADVLHAASLNTTGARRRSILISYFAEPRYAAHLQTASLRNIRADTVEWFEAT